MTQIGFLTPIIHFLEFGLKRMFKSLGIILKIRFRLYNLFLNIRNTEDYPFNNLFIITELTYPQGKTLSDTLEYAMAYPDGKLIGTGFTSLKENKLIYKEGFRFDETGEYTFQISQAMRKYDQINGVKELKGISDVGLPIESKK